jgi:ribonuclease HI
MNKIFVFTDGGSRGNPGPAAVGIVIKAESGDVLKRINKRIGETTNNVAEYTAVVEALKWIKNNLPIEPFSHVSTFEFYLDSTLVVNQLNGLFRVKDGNMRNLVYQVRLLEQEIGTTITYRVVPREKNWEADIEVNKALDS